MRGDGEGGSFEGVCEGVCAGGEGGVVLHLDSDGVVGFRLELKLELETILGPYTAVVTCFIAVGGDGSEVLGSEGIVLGGVL